MSDDHFTKFAALCLLGAAMEAVLTPEPRHHVPHTPARPSDADERALRRAAEKRARRAAKRALPSPPAPA